LSSQEAVEGFMSEDGGQSPRGQKTEPQGTEARTTEDG